MINHKDIISKFGTDLIVDEDTYRLGIGVWFSDHLAKRFSNRVVLETCSGGGFSTVSLSKYAKYVFSFEIDEKRVRDATENCKRAGNITKVRFIKDSIYNIRNYDIVKQIDSAFIDPDWDTNKDNYVFRFTKSMTKPPSDELFGFINSITKNILLIQPPYIENHEFSVLGNYELEELYYNNEYALKCIYTGDLVKKEEITQYKVIVT